MGCGYGKWGFLARIYFHATADGDETSEPSVYGIDRYFGHLERLKRHGIYGAVVQASGIELPFKGRSFDTVLALELIEHLSKDEGLVLVRECERVGRKAVILSTPNFDDFRGGREGLDGYNPHEAHVSRWKIRELKSLGFACYGVGVKCVPGALQPVMGGFSYRAPWLGKLIIGVKLLC